MPATRRAMEWPRHVRALGPPVCLPLVPCAAAGSGMSTTVLPILSKRRQPVSCSSAFIEWLIADCDRCSSLAVVVKLAVRARMEKARSGLLSSGCDMDERDSSFASKSRKLFLHPGAARWHGGS